MRTRVQSRMDTLAHGAVVVARDHRRAGARALWSLSITALPYSRSTPSCHLQSQRKCASRCVRSWVGQVDGAYAAIGRDARVAHICFRPVSRRCLHFNGRRRHPSHLLSSHLGVRWWQQHKQRRSVIAAQWQWAHADDQLYYAADEFQCRSSRRVFTGTPRSRSSQSGQRPPRLATAGG